MKTVNLKDIAAEAGVSVTAVCKVVNNQPMRISRDKRENILKIAKKLNYSPNLIARSLRNKKTKTIGIVVPDISTLFYPELIKTMETAFFYHGYRCIICNTQDKPSLEKIHLEDLIGRWIDGLVLSPASGRANIKFFREIVASRRPFLMIDRYFPDENIPYLTSENSEGAGQAIRFLSGNKVLRVVYLGEKARNQALDDRLAGVKAEAASLKIPFSPGGIFFCENSREKIKKICSAIFQKITGGKKTGVFLESNRMLPGFLDAAKERDLLIPDDVEIIGFDSFEPEMVDAQDFLSMTVLKKPLPIIMQDTEKMARETVKYIISCLEGKKQSLSMRIPVKPVNFFREREK